MEMTCFFSEITFSSSDEIFLPGCDHFIFGNDMVLEMICFSSAMTCFYWEIDMFLFGNIVALLTSSELVLLEPHRK